MESRWKANVSTLDIQCAMSKGDGSVARRTGRPRNGRIELLRGTELARNASGFFFQWTDAKAGGIKTFAKIFLNKGLEAATAFTLGDVDELMHQQLAIAPAIGPNNNSVTNTCTTRSGGNDDVSSREIREPFVFWQRKAFHDQNSDPGSIPNANLARVSGVLRG